MPPSDPSPPRDRQDPAVAATLAPEATALGSTAGSDPLGATAGSDPLGSTVAEPSTPPSPASSPPAGSPFAAGGGFVPRGVLGRGGMGRVVLADDPRLGRPVAIKELLAPTEAARARFEREVRLAARLQHPNIVPVYTAGTNARGEPYYAMRPVEGRTLAQAIDAAVGRADRLALVPRVVAVAEAIAFAHRGGVIHRDLKPTNILIGEHGETVVIDWGLAKETTDDDGAASAPTASTSGDLTHDGSVIGTPAYMPPEQARGEPLDARADVYALGAILYHVLAGVAPYHGVRSADALLDEVRRGPPARLATLAPDLAPDLIAIVERAMRRDRAARYPDARGLADDLARFLAGRLVAAHAYSLRQLARRWLARHRVAVTVAAIAAAVLVGLGVYAFVAIRAERGEAVRARIAADARRRDAEDLVDFMLGDLHDRLEKIGDLAAMAGSTDRIASYLAKHPPDPGDRAGLRRRVAFGAQLAGVAAATGDLPRAERELRAALAIAEPAERDDDLPLAELAHDARTDLATRLLAQGRAAEALPLVDRALADARRLAAGGSLPWRRRIANDLFDRSRVREATAEPGLARDDTTAALAAYRAVLADAPDNAVAERDVARCLSRLAGLTADTGDEAGGLPLAREAVATFERLAARAPDTVLPRVDLMFSLQRLVRFELAGGDRGAARAAAEKSVTLAERLIVDEPARTEHPASLARSLALLARMARDDGDFAAALALGRRALATFERVAATEPDKLLWQMNVAEAHDQIAATLRRSGDKRAALAEYEPAFAVRRRIVAAAPSAPQHALDLAQDLDNASLLAKDLGDHATAARRALEAARLREPVTGAHPDRRTRVLTALSYLRAGGELAATGDREGAGDAYRRGAAITDALAAEAAPDAELTEVARALAAGLAACCGG